MLRFISKPNAARLSARYGRIVGNLGVHEVSMYEKHNRFYADWRDRRGVRRRKAFTTADAATAHEVAQKAVARPHGGAVALPSQPSSRGTSKPPSRPARTSTSSSQKNTSSRSQGRSARATSVKQTSSKSSRKGRTSRKAPATVSARRTNASSTTSTKSTARRRSRSTSLASSLRPRAPSPSVRKKKRSS